MWLIISAIFIIIWFIFIYNEERNSTTWSNNAAAFWTWIIITTLLLYLIIYHANIYNQCVIDNKDLILEYKIKYNLNQEEAKHYFCNGL